MITLALIRSMADFAIAHSSIPMVRIYTEHLVNRIMRRNRWNLMPPEVPLPVRKLRAPRGFRFASEPPDLNDLVHLANDHPYLAARKGERVDFLSGYGASSKLVNVGIVLGRMNDDDSRAHVVNPSGGPGLYIREQQQEPRWYPSSRIFREVDGRLTIRK